MTGPAPRRPALDRDDALLVAAGVGALLLFVAAELRTAGTVGLPLDDSWIHLRFATNLAMGRGFGLNPGEPVAGSTAPLWTLLLAAVLAAGRALGLAPAATGLAAAKTAGVLAYLAAGLLTRRLALALQLGRGLALGAGLGAVLLGRLVWGALSGMEVPMAAALVALGALLAVRGRPVGAAATLALAALARPEAGLLIPLHLVGILRGEGGSPRPGPGVRGAPDAGPASRPDLGPPPRAAGRAWRDAALGAVVAGLVLTPAVLFNLATVGRLVPATAAAKVEGGLLGQAEGLRGAWAVAGARAGAYLAEWGALLARDHRALPWLAALGLVLLWRGRSAARWLALALVLHPLAVAALAPYRGPAFQTGRYSSHLLPLTLAAAAAGLGALLARLPWAWGRRGLALLLLAGLLWPLGPAARAYAWGVQNIDAMQVRLGRWVARETPPDALLAVNDIGALTYFGHRRVVDLMGLATPEILPFRREGPAGILRYLERTCPDYLVIFPAWFPALAARADLFRPVERVRLVHNEVAGAAEMVVYETVWRRAPCARDPIRPETSGAGD